MVSKNIDKNEEIKILNENIDEFIKRIAQVSKIEDIE